MGRRIHRVIGLAILATAATLAGPEAQAGHRYSGRSNSGYQQAARQQQAAIRAEAKYEQEMARQRQIFLNGWAAEQMAAGRRARIGTARREAAIDKIQAKSAIQPAKSPAPAPAPAPASGSSASSAAAK